MKNYTLTFISFILLVMVACNNKKLKEVVEVPLPTVEEKMTIGHPDDVQADEGTFKMIKLPYGYDALAPNIDALTMDIHYSKHYLTYTNNLNKAIAGTEMENLPIEDILKKIDVTNTNLKKNAGGYYNHTLFWECLMAKNNGEPKDTLATAIKRDFGSFDAFKTQFATTASEQFGSGWTWLVTDSTGKLQVTNTSNQDNPLMANAVIKGTPILALDLWEHAYYLNYQYKRQKYIDTFFKVINWKKVAEKYEEAIKK